VGVKASGALLYLTLGQELLDHTGDWAAPFSVSLFSFFFSISFWLVGRLIWQASLVTSSPILLTEPIISFERMMFYSKSVFVRFRRCCSFRSLWQSVLTFWTPLSAPEQFVSIFGCACYVTSCLCIACIPFYAFPRTAVSRRYGFWPQAFRIATTTGTPLNIQMDVCLQRVFLSFFFILYVHSYNLLFSLWIKMDVRNGVWMGWYHVVRTKR
jgi:hypothetical protein